MGFSLMMEFLQKKNEGKIVICNAGNFYVAIGKDAVLLNNLLELKVTCFKPETCKIGFPNASLEKYTDLIQEKGYSFIVYYFDQKKEELEILLDYTGKNKNETTTKRLNCYICKHSTMGYKKEDKYMLALAKLYEKEEIEEKEQEEKEKLQKKRKKIWYRKNKKKTN